jgi:hypothetical protein
MRAGMDIKDADGAPDREAWMALERQAVELMMAAYYRNHCG